MSRRTAPRATTGGPTSGPPGFPAKRWQSIGFPVNDNRPSPFQRIRGFVRIVVGLASAALAALFLFGS